jgi:hypothetical protein
MERRYDIESWSELSPADAAVLLRDWYEDWYQGREMQEIARECSVSPRVLRRLFTDQYEHDRLAC